MTLYRCCGQEDNPPAFLGHPLEECSVDDVFPKRGKDADNDNIDNRESEKRNKKETLRVICREIRTGIGT